LTIDSRLSTSLADRYRIEREVGQGGMATVYLATDLRHQRKVAVKVLRPELAALIGAERFLAEITTTAALQHPHILPLFDSGQAVVRQSEQGNGPHSFLYYVMPFIEGESLGGLLNGMASGSKDAPHASLHTLLTIFLKACDAVAFAHASGVVHGCLHPETIIFGRYGEVFVDHWGTARIGPPRDADRPQLVAPEVSAPPPISCCLAPEQAGKFIDDLRARGPAVFTGCHLKKE